MPPRGSREKKKGLFCFGLFWWLSDACFGSFRALGKRGKERARSLREKKNHLKIKAWLGHIEVSSHWNLTVTLMYYLRPVWQSGMAAQKQEPGQSWVSGNKVLEAKLQAEVMQGSLGSWALPAPPGPSRSCLRWAQVLNNFFPCVFVYSYVELYVNTCNRKFSYQTWPVIRFLKSF